jgi:hypothetical protein
MQVRIPSTNTRLISDFRSSLKNKARIERQALRGPGDIVPYAKTLACLAVRKVQAILQRRLRPPNKKTLDPVNL